jgi:23S rRNA pseudouridine2605 synthase
MNLERLQKVLAHHQVASRRASEQLILDNRVKVNGEIVNVLGTKVSEYDIILVDDKPITKQPLTYFLMNKPNGTISSVKDEKGRKTVLDLLEKEDLDTHVYPVGRLDYNTSGLLLLTNDGELTQKLTHPKFKVDKTYMAVVDGLVSRLAVKTLKTGVKLETYVAKAYYVKVVEARKEENETLIQIVLTQGKHHQVREMLEALGYPVKKLTRTQYAFLNLEGVQRGGYRPLKVHEVKKLYGYQLDAKR